MKQLTVEFNNEKQRVYYAKTKVDFMECIRLLSQNPAKICGLDIETAKQDRYISHKESGLHPAMSFIRLIQIYNGKDTFVFDLGTSGSAATDAIRYASLRDFLRVNTLIAHYAIFELKHLMTWGVEPKCHCSMLMAQFIETAEFSPFEPDEDEDDEFVEMKYRNKGGMGLANLTKRYFNINVDKLLQVSDWNAEVLTDEQIVYAGLDAILTYKIGKLLLPKIKSYKMMRAYKLFRDMQYVIADMENTGMLVDTEAHNKLIAEWIENRSKCETLCKNLFGNINLNSTKQLHNWVVATVTDKKLLKKWPKSDKTGNYSFNKNALIPLTESIPVLNSLLDFKKLSTLINTFGDSLQRKINPATGRLHCSFTLGETRTGRLSSRNPNLQNMPSRQGSFKNIFVPAKGYSLVVADFSQIEIRVAGEISGDPIIKQAYIDGIDLHKAIVADLGGKKIEEVTNEERQLGKAINFGLQFGMGAAKLVLYAFNSYGVVMSDEEAQKAWVNYHTKYKVYSAWCKEQRAICNKLGRVRTPMGKLRKLEEAESYTRTINTPIQGGAAEVIFQSMVILRQQIKSSKFDCKIINTVHDEIIVECPTKYVEHAKSLLDVCMAEGFTTVFPGANCKGLVEAHYGKNWAEAK